MRPQPLKLHIINRYFYPVTAGIETYLVETTRYLSQMGWSITVHCSRDDLAQKNRFKNQGKLGHVTIRRYQSGKFGFWPAIPWTNVDIVSLQNFTLLPHLHVLVYCLLLKLLRKKKFALVLTPHGGFTALWPLFSPKASRLKKIIHQTIGKFLINQAADAVIAVSVWEKKELVQAGIKPKLLWVIENGIEDQALKASGLGSNNAWRRDMKRFGKYLIQVGRIDPVKNLETTIKALTLLPSTINFVIVGPVSDKQYYRQLKELIRTLTLSRRVFFVGIVRGREKFQLIKRAQLMVHMSRYENNCLAVLDGLSQGKVCVVANNTGLVSQIAHGVNGYRIPTDDYQQLAKKIGFVLKNTGNSTIGAIEKRNRQKASANTWQVVTQKLDGSYRRLHQDGVGSTVDLAHRIYYNALLSFGIQSNFRHIRHIIPTFIYSRR